MSTDYEPEPGLDIAVVGMAGRFPGAGDVDELWRLVVEGREAISFFDREQLVAAGVPADEAGHPDYVPAYGVLPGVQEFDAEFFGYTPRDARLLDPQQRLFLECAWEALEAAGHLAAGPDELVGVYAGASMSSYLLRNLLDNPELSSTSEYELVLANDKDSLASRVSYHLDLRGPAVSVQTACSSSLVAIHQAAQALLAHECDVALAGGVHVRVPMESGYRYEPGGIMSRDGHCRPFEAGASGTIGGNGAGVVVLRRLSDAIRDADTIYAVVKGSAINNDGGVKIGFTAPSVDGQVAAIRMAQDAAGVEPETIGYVETHGTATSLGDQIEFQALVEAFGTGGSGHCALGAVKALVGHLDAAAGVTGFIKASLAVHHGVIPPSPYFREPNPALGLAASPFYVNAAARAWPEPSAARRAAVSSFGIGGTNAHAVLEEPPACAAEPSRRSHHLIVLSARSAAALASMREQVADRLRSDGELSLADTAFTLQATRRPFAHRFAMTCGDRAEAAARLTGGAHPAARTGVAEREDHSVAFLFPGQGAQYPQMGAGLYREEPTFRRSFDACRDILASRFDIDLGALVYPDTADASAPARLSATAHAQPALFAVEYALAQLWMEWGLRPAAMTGHSIGEYVAACVAGVFSLEDALATVAVRGRLMQEMAPGAMLSVHLPVTELGSLLSDGVTLAALNAPRLSVVAGAADAVAAAAATLQARGVECRPLHTSHAFHSPAMDAVLEPFAEYVGRLTLRAPKIPIVSSLTGDWLTPEEATDPAYWARQLRHPVRFSDTAELLLAQRHALLEVGPGTALATFVRQHDAARDRTIVSSLSHPARPRPDGAALADALGRLWLAGVTVDWQGVWTHERRRRRPLPTYPFQRRRHWIEPSGAPAVARAAVTTATSQDRGPEEAPAAAPLAAPPRDEACQAIRRIWVEMLGLPDVGEHDNFFELGGHSLLGTKIVARIRDALGVELPASALFEWPTISELAAATARATTAPDPGEHDEVAPELLAEILAMSPQELQEQIDLERRRADQGDGGYQLSAHDTTEERP